MQVFINETNGNYFVTEVNGKGYYSEDSGQANILGHEVYNLPSGLSRGDTKRVLWEYLKPVSDMRLADHIINIE